MFFPIFIPPEKDVQLDITGVPRFVFWTIAVLDILMVVWIVVMVWRS